MAEPAPEVNEDFVQSLTDDLLADTAGLDEPAFHGIQFDRGLARVDFPIGHGGLAASPKLQRIVDEALEHAGRSGDWMRNPMGIGMCGPTIAACGTEEQMSRFLRPIFTAEEIWCQLFSEPGAGSDVAGLATRAEPDGTEWVVNGQKVWTSLAHLASWGLLLARTDPYAPKHRGLTAFIIDMRQPGVETRPLRQMSGIAEFNEVFLTDARVPDDLRIGEPGEGWRVANATLMNERVSIGGNARASDRGPVAQAIDLWRRRGNGNPVQRDRFVRLWIDGEVLRLGSIRAQALRAKGVPGPEGSVLKLAQARLSRAIAEFTVDLLGPAGAICTGYPSPGDDNDRGQFSGDPVLAFLSAQSSTIAGGTSEIMGNILGERVLGLPREPGMNTNAPWNEIPRN